MTSTTNARCKGGLDAAVSLFAAASPMTASHWNVLTGEVFQVRRGKRSRPRLAAFEERLFDEKGWHEVPFQESDDAYSMAVDFVDELSPGKGRSALRAAVEGDKPFRRFRDALKQYLGLQRRYKTVVAEEALGRLVVFCVANGLQVDDRRFASAAKELEREFAKTDAASPVLSMTSLSIGRK